MTREEIEKDVAAFLKRGGKIQHIPMGVGSFNMAETFEGNAVRNRKPKNNRGLAISLSKRRQAKEKRRG
jgi:hypothetical protein